MKKSILLPTVLLLNTAFSFAQTLGLESAASDFWDEVRGAAPYILAGILLVSCFFNIGKVTGADRDYKAFLTGIALFFFGVLLIVALITYLLSLSF